MIVCNKEYNFNIEKEAKKAINFLVISQMKNHPFLCDLLVNLTDIENVCEEEKNSLAYTYYNYTNNRIKICVNFQKIQNGIMDVNGEIYLLNQKDLYCIILHELLHNFFMHLTRFNSYLEEGYGKVVNIVTDYYCNEFLLRLSEDSKHFLQQNNFGFILFEELKKISIENGCGDLPFKDYDSKPLEQKVIDHLIRSEKNWLPNKSENSLYGEPGELKTGGDHESGIRQQKKSLKEVNEKRVSEGKKELEEKYAKDLIETYVKMGVNDSNKEVGQSEEELLRTFKKINKKDPFLNYLKITSTMKTMSENQATKLYRRASRRKQDEDIIYKGKVKSDVEKVVIGIDVSGSVSENELECIYNLVGSFAEKRKNEINLDVVFWSSCEIEPRHYNENISSFSDLIKLKVHSSMGTEITYLYNYLEKRYKNEKITFLNITDGYFHYPKEPEVFSKHYVVLTENGKEDEIRKAYKKAIIKSIRVTP